MKSFANDEENGTFLTVNSRRKIRAFHQNYPPNFYLLAWSESIAVQHHPRPFFFFFCNCYVMTLESKLLNKKKDSSTLILFFRLHIPRIFTYLCTKVKESYVTRFLVSLKLPLRDLNNDTFQEKQRNKMKLRIFCKQLFFCVTINDCKLIAC